MAGMDSPPLLTLDVALRNAAGRIDAVDAQWLLLHVLQQPHGWLFAHRGDSLREDVAAAFETLVARRERGEPVAYLTGRRGFWSLDLDVDAAVLIPRPETELLVELALQRIAPESTATIADLGTGSGAIALAIAQQRPLAQVVAVDASADALAVARANAERLGLRVDMRLGDWLTPVAGERLDLIVSNPPYIADTDPHLPALAHEPRQALVSGADGLDDIRRIVAQAPAHLAPGGWLLLEHGWDQAGAVRALLSAAGFAQVQSRRDLAGIERCSGARYPDRRAQSSEKLSN